ncbi:MAG: hypothetical protein EXR07_06670 [Acetobacteraceae bacterium]|nr:hypothetical protein [Acetobacteraceae bacterium]
MKTLPIGHNLTGAWFTPDATGMDTNGCDNALTTDRSVPCGATTYNTNHVQVMLDGCQTSGVTA